MQRKYCITSSPSRYCVKNPQINISNTMNKDSNDDTNEYVNTYSREDHMQCVRPFGCLFCVYDPLKASDPIYCRGYGLLQIVLVGIQLNVKVVPNRDIINDLGNFDENIISPQAPYVRISVDSHPMCESSVLYDKEFSVRSGSIREAILDERIEMQLHSPYSRILFQILDKDCTSGINTDYDDIFGSVLLNAETLIPNEVYDLTMEFPCITVDDYPGNVQTTCGEIKQTKNSPFSVNVDEYYNNNFVCNKRVRSVIQDLVTTPAAEMLINGSGSDKNLMPSCSFDNELCNHGCILRVLLKLKCSSTINELFAHCIPRCEEITPERSVNFLNMYHDAIRLKSILWDRLISRLLRILVNIKNWENFTVSFPVLLLWIVGCLYFKYIISITLLIMFLGIKNMKTFDGDHLISNNKIRNYSSSAVKYGKDKQKAGCMQETNCYSMESSFLKSILSSAISNDMQKLAAHVHVQILDAIKLANILGKGIVENRHAIMMLCLTCGVISFMYPDATNLVMKYALLASGIIFLTKQLFVFAFFYRLTIGFMKYLVNNRNRRKVNKHFVLQSDLCMFHL